MYAAKSIIMLILLAIYAKAVTPKTNSTDFANSKAVKDIMINPDYQNVFNKLKLVCKFREDLIERVTIRTARELKSTTPGTTRNFTAEASDHLERELLNKPSVL